MYVITEKNKPKSPVICMYVCIFLYLTYYCNILHVCWALYPLKAEWTLYGVSPKSTQPSIPPGSVNEYQLRLGRQRQVWLIPIADERVGVQIKL